MILSVCMITYNHEKYIAQAIESALMQNTNFDYEIVIGEDCSTDKTREIVKFYAEKHPEKIRAIFNEKNLGMIANFINTLNNCRGIYIAMLEGDDYWTDPFKLQKQVDFLESNPEYSVCFHHVDIINEEGKLLLKNRCKSPHKYTQKDFFIGDGRCSWTCSMTFNKEFLPNPLPAWFYMVKAGDKFLKLILTSKHEGYVMANAMACYRVHPGGAWSTLGIINIHEKAREDLFYMLKYFGDRYINYVDLIIAKFHFNSIYYYIYNKEYKKAQWAYLRIFKYYRNVHISPKEFIKRFLVIIFPNLFSFYLKHFYKKAR